jgi:N4-gp56 family major capsid protein
MSYSPASIVSSGALPNLVAIHYEREAVPNLKAQTPFLSMTKQRPLPLRQGNQIQFYTYALLAANLNQAAEGTVGSPISESSNKIVATIGQYADFINSSDLALDVAIDDPGLLQNLANELNYRLALTLNSLVQITADSAVAVDSLVNSTLANGSYLVANNIRSAAQSLVSVNARPLVDNKFGGIIHPNVVRDVLNDTSFNGLTDIIKRDESMRKMLFDLPANEDTISFAGVTFKQTSTAPTVTISGNTYYNSYIFGEDAIFSVFLGKNPNDGSKNYKLFIQSAPEQGSSSDPARQIGGWVSYNVRYTNTLRPGSTMTLRRLQSETSSS